MLDVLTAAAQFIMAADMKYLHDFITRQLHRSLISFREPDILECFIGIDKGNRLYGIKWGDEIVDDDNKVINIYAENYFVKNGLTYCGRLEIANNINQLWWLGFEFHYERKIKEYRSAQRDKLERLDLRQIVKFSIVECEKFSKQLASFEV